jgi:hypothetical protein
LPNQSPNEVTSPSRSSGASPNDSSEKPINRPGKGTSLGVLVALSVAVFFLLGGIYS